MAGPLDGVKVLDLTRVLAGPYATMVLSDLGAEVIKVERPEGGDMARGTGPFIDGQSSYFMSINRGKKSVILDFKDEGDKQTFLELLDHFDVLVENFVPGVMKRLGLDYEVLSKRHPRLIYAAVSGFGQWGPYTKRPALDIIVQAMGGIMSITGEPGRPPVRPGSSLGDITAGLFTTIGILSALHERDRSGVGQMIDVAMLDCQTGRVGKRIRPLFHYGRGAYAPWHPAPGHDTLPGLRDQRRICRSRLCRRGQGPVANFLRPPRQSRPHRR